MFAARGFTPLLINLENMAEKPRAYEGSKNGATWDEEKVVRYFILRNKFTTDSSAG